MAYACDKCGGVFVEPSSYTECLTMDPPAYEKRSQSPCCGAGYEKVVWCPVCGEYTRSERPGGLCGVCARESVLKLREFLGWLDVAEIRWLDQLLDGVSLEEFRDGK